MAHLLPENPFDFDYGQLIGEGSSFTALSLHPPPPRRDFSLPELLASLLNSQTREEAITILARNRNICDDMAPLLWNSFGTMAVLLQELVSVYVLMTEQEFPEKPSTRVCNVLALFQSLAYHPATKKQFINAQIPMYLYPLFESSMKGKTHEFVRISALGVIGAMVKVGDLEIMKYLIRSELYPKLLNCMEIGGEISRTIATFILQKMLLTNIGLRYSCSLAERFYATNSAMEKMLIEFPQISSDRLARFIVGCYLKLSEDSRGCDGLKLCLPKSIKSTHVLQLLKNDPTAVGWLKQLLYNVETGHRSRPSSQNLVNRMLIKR